MPSAADRNLSAMARYTEALDDLRRAATLDRTEDGDLIRSLRARTFAHAGDSAGAVAAAEAGEASTVGEAVYNTAAAHALLGTRERRAGETHGPRAVALLNRARACGFFATPSEIARFATDRDFASVYQRLDFRAFFADVNFPADTFAR
jgi:hypothetical protein